VAAEGLDGSPRVGFNDPCIWGITYYDTEAGIWRSGSAVDWRGKFLFGEEDVSFCVEEAKVFVV
jgi:hypothetical protein